MLATGTNAVASADVYANQAALPARWRANARFTANLSIMDGYRVLIKGFGLTESLVDDSGPRPRMAGGAKVGGGGHPLHWIAARSPPRSPAR